MGWAAEVHLYGKWKRKNPVRVKFQSRHCGFERVFHGSLALLSRGSTGQTCGLPPCRIA